MTRLEALKTAIHAAKGQTKLASALGLRSQGAVSNWVRRGYVPAERVLAVEAATGVSRHDLRPDIYPRETRRRSDLQPTG